MTRRRITTGSPFETAIGYSRAVVQEPWCFVSGTTGYDYARMVMPEDVAEQAENALSTIARTLEQAGFSMADVVRATHILTDPRDVEAVVPVIRRHLGQAGPASTMLIAGLMKPEMKVEIEVTALRQPRDGA